MARPALLLAFALFWSAAVDAVRLLAPPGLGSGSLAALNAFYFTLAGAAVGTLLLTALTALLGPWLQAQYGLGLKLAPPSWQELELLGWVILAGTLASLLPGYRAYRLSLADGLTPRV